MLIEQSSHQEYYYRQFFIICKKNIIIIMKGDFSMSEYNDNIPQTDNMNNGSTNKGYSFWAEQAATKDDDINKRTTESNSYDVNSYYNTYNNNTSYGFNYNQEFQSSNTEPEKKSRKRMRRFCSFTAKAAIFGVVASAAFLGFNSMYYHLNPDAKSYSQGMHTGNSMLNLERPSKNEALSTTTVSQGVKINSSDVSALVEKTMPATVSISSVFDNSYYMWGQQYQQESEGGGSGIIIGKTDSELLIATNNHVVEDAKKIIINFIDNTTAEAIIKGRDSQADLAVVSVDITKLSKDTLEKISVASLGDSDSVKVGQMVVAIGNALGYGQSVTVGYISAKDREISISNTNNSVSKMTVLQTDAAINPGNSGGALINMNGEVIGINSAKLANTDVEGIGYAIPISNALPIVNELKDREILTDDEKGYLGIQINNIDSEMIESFNWPEGVYISLVTEDGAAKKAGLLQGDIITAINGVKVTSAKQLQEIVTSYRYDTTVKVTYQRIKDGTYQEYTVDAVLQKAANTSVSSNENNPSDTDNALKNEDSQNNDNSQDKNGSNNSDNNSNSYGNGSNQGQLDNQIPENQNPNNSPYDSDTDLFNDLNEFFNRVMP